MHTSSDVETGILTIPLSAKFTVYPENHMNMQSSTGRIMIKKTDQPRRKLS